LIPSALAIARTGRFSLKCIASIRAWISGFNIVTASVMLPFSGRKQCIEECLATCVPAVFQASCSWLPALPKFQIFRKYDPPRASAELKHKHPAAPASIVRASDARHPGDPPALLEMPGASGGRVACFPRGRSWNMCANSNDAHGHRTGK